MADLSARPDVHASSLSLAELHQLCDEDYIKGQQQRATPRLAPSYAALSMADLGPVPEPTDLDVAIRVAQQLLDSDSVISLRESARLLLRAVSADSDSAPILREILRLLLSAVGAEPAAERLVRCPAAHPDDPTPCDGPPSVTVLDATNAGAKGCEHHGARLLASLEGGRVYGLPDAPAGTAIRVFKAADGIRPFPWVDGPRTKASQLSRAENRRRGEGQ